MPPPKLLARLMRCTVDLNRHRRTRSRMPAMLRITLLGSLALEAGRFRSLSTRTPVEWLADATQDFLNADLLIRREDEQVEELPAPAGKLVTSWAQVPTTGAALDAAVQEGLNQVYGFVVGYAPQLWTACRWVRSLAHPASGALGISTLVLGESGTGKELVARALHRLGARAGGPFLAVNCAELPRELAVSILFGHVKGAFTGADAPHRGYFEAVKDGVLFLDEVGDLPLDLQPLLLRALEQREFTRVGETVPRFFQGQLVSATNRRLDQDVTRGSFRADLYFRIAQVSIPLPALRERPAEDFPLLVRALLAGLGDDSVLPPGELLGVFPTYPWPGNVRELRSVLQRWLLLRSTGQNPALADLLPALGPPGDVPAQGTLAEMREDFDRRVLQNVLAGCGGDTKKAALELGITRRSVYNLAKRYRIPIGPKFGE